MHFQIPSHSSQHFEPQAKQENFQIYLRLKPLFHNEPSQVIKQISDTKLEIVSPYYYETQRTFQFDKILPQTTTNLQLFQSCLVSPINNILSGFNSTVLIYGATGAGKTYTMFGDGQQAGVVPVALNRIFSALKSNGSPKSQLSLSFYEIYNQSIRDLLQEESSPLNIMEDPNRGIIISQLSQHTILNQQEAINLLEEGIQRRAINATKSNQVSSRSHAIFQLTLKQFSPAARDKFKMTESKLFLVDLAGNEKSCSTGTSMDKRFVEGININKSLLTLGKCINILAERKNQFVPFRDSKLTRILKQSLGGNSKTVMIACVSLERQYYQETLNTLKYSSLAKNIRNKKVKNVKEVDKLFVSSQLSKSLRNKDTDSTVQMIQALILSVEDKIRTREILENLCVARQKNQQIFNRTKDNLVSEKMDQINKFMQQIKNNHQQSAQKTHFYRNKLLQIITFHRQRQCNDKKIQLQQARQIQQLRAQVKQQHKKIQILDKPNSLHINIAGSPATVDLQNLKNINKSSIKINPVSKKSPPLEIDLKSSICLEKQNISGASKVFNKKSKQIVIDLNSKSTKQQFVDDLRILEKRIRDPGSQKEIERLLSLHQLHQFELNNVEQSVLRKIKFFQDKKANGSNSNQSRHSFRGFSVGRNGK